jgi:hypothetical protein
LIMLILNCNFNLVLWKMAENIIQINDSWWCNPTK